jgi:hypothetical protein
LKVRCQPQPPAGAILLTSGGVVWVTRSPALQAPDQVREAEQIVGAERRSPGTHRDDRLRRHHVRPPRWELPELPLGVVEVDPVLLPHGAVVEELELPAMQRVERVGHPEKTSFTDRMTCS